MRRLRYGKWFYGFATAALVMTLGACANSESEEPKAESGSQEQGAGENRLFSIEDFNNIKTNMGEAIEGGTLNFGLVSDTAFDGTLNFNFYNGNPDQQVLQFFDEPLLTWDENYLYTQDGAATYEVSEDGKTFTFTIRDNVYWHDGEPVTARDWVFAHEVIAHPDYDGVRFGANKLRIVGMEEYRNGEADEIAGLRILNERQLEMEFTEATPSLLTGGIWTYPLAYHIFKDIPVADMSSSPEVRQHPIGFGPFMVDTIVPGESVTYKANENYWRGAPTLEGVTLRVISPATVIQELRTGGVDIVSSFPIDQFPENAELSNLEWLGNVDRAYTYIGFKLGHWDDELGENVMDPDAKMADVNLRRAMWHAIDNETVGERFYHGLRWEASTLIPPSHPQFQNTNLERPVFDPELANQILDDAGYVDTTGDGFRDNPDGTPLVINFASMTGDDVAEPLAQYYVQAWNNIGLNVESTMLEFNTFYEQVGADHPDIDVYQAAWVVGIDVDPTNLYGRIGPSNYSRFTSENNDRLLVEGASEAAFDLDYRREIYNEWQEYMIEQIPVIPTLWRSALAPVNNRVLNYGIGDGTGLYLYQVALTQEEPIVAE